MAFTESDRANIRHALGFSAIFLQAEPRLENAITAVQSTVDGGTRPDSSTETQIKGWLTDITTVEANLKALWPMMMAVKADDATIDPLRGAMMLRSEGRRLVTYIARALGTVPRADVFSATNPSPSGTPFPDIEDGENPGVRY